jgi:hypothetical protein
MSYECYVVFALYPKNIHPDEISKMLHVTPTRKNIAGEVKTNSFGVTRKIKIPSWFLSSKDLIKSAYLEDHLELVLDKLQPLKGKLIELQQEAVMNLQCVCRSKSNHNIQTLSKQHCKIIADLNLEFYFDAYFDNFLDILQEE